MGAIAGNSRCAHVGGAGASRLQRLGDPAGHELVVARRLRALAPLDVALALLAGVVPGLLPRQELGEDVGLAAPRRAPVALAAVAGPAVGAVELDPRACVLTSRAPHPRCARPRHAARVAPQSDGIAQLDARGACSSPHATATELSAKTSLALWPGRAPGGVRKVSLTKLRSATARILAHGVCRWSSPRRRPLVQIRGRNL